MWGKLKNWKLCLVIFLAMFIPSFIGGTLHTRIASNKIYHSAVFDFQKMAKIDKQAIDSAIDFYHHAFCLVEDNVSHKYSDSDSTEFSDMDHIMVLRVVVYDESRNVVKSIPDTPYEANYTYVFDHDGHKMGFSYGMQQIFIEDKVETEDGSKYVVFDGKYIDQAVKLGNLAKWETTEVVLATNGNSEYVRFLYPLRKDKDIKQFHKNDINIPILYAVRGEETLFENYVDYVGDKVIAYSAHIESAGLGLVFKADAYEVLDPIKDLWAIYWTIGIAYIVLAGICSVLMSNIIETQRQEEKLLLSKIDKDRNLLRTVIDASPDLIFVKDLDSRYIVANAAFANHYQTTIEKVLGKRISDLNKTTESKEFENDDLQVTTSGNAIISKEETSLDMQGNTVTFSMTKVPIRDSNGKIFALVGVGRDVTVRLAESRALKESEYLFRSMFESTSIGIAMVNTDGSFIKVNQAFGSMLGYEVEELTNMAFQDVTHPDDIDMSNNLVKEMVDSSRKRKKQLQKRYIHKDGRTVHAVIGIFLMVDEDGIPEKFITQIVNITDLITLQHNLADRESRLLAQFDNSAIGMSIVKLDGSWLEVNDALCDMVGYDREELLNTDFQSITHKDDLEKYIQKVEELIDGRGTHYEMEKRYIHKDGYTIWILLVGSIIRDENEKPLYFVSQIMDITEKKAWEHRLEESNKELSRFAYMASHDLKEPLRTIDSYLKLIKEKHGEVKDKDTQTFFRHVFEANDRMERMIDGLLHYSRAEEGNLVYTNIQLDQIVKDHAINDLHDVIEEKNADIICSDLDQEFEGDAVQIGRLIHNIVSNSLKYSHPDRKPVVKIVGTESSYFVVILVSDNGIGIPLKDQNDVFKMFYKSSNSGSRSGSGIGLAVCKKIAELHDGYIYLESKEGSGSTFSISIPKKRMRK